MMFPLYTLAYTGALLAAGPFYLLRGRRQGKYFWNLSERLGRTRPDLGAKSGDRVWLHALSLGEVISSEELTRRLGAEGCQVCLSATTKSGFETAKARPSLSWPPVCFPLDWPPAVTRVLQAVRPDLFVLVETDIWPNFLAGLAGGHIPAVLVNARLSPRSLAGYRAVKSWWSRVLNLFFSIGCQTGLDRERFLSLGLSPDRLVVTGNLKYDLPQPATGPAVRAEFSAETGLPQGLWLVGGSTHEGEEDVLLDIFTEFQPHYPTLKLLLAPRDRHRFEAVWRMILERGLPAARRSEPRPRPDLQVFLLDTQGELARFYEPADLVFVGKSLAGPSEGGGHNLLEPALRAKPVLFGPRMHNFTEMAALMVQAGGGRQVTGPAELKAAVTELLADPAERTAMGLRAGRAFQAHRGALDRTMALIHQALAARKVRAA